MIQHLNITLYGQVQGVFLRRTVEHEANRRGIVGCVRNEPDGTVYVESEAEEATLKKFVEWLKAGASGGGDFQIAQVEIEEGTFKAFSEFEIR